MSEKESTLDPRRILGVVLAAGEGKRFGGPKAPYLYQGRRLVDIAVSNLREAGLSNVLVVTGAWHGDVPGAMVISNEEWRSGMSSSLAAAIRWAQPQAEFESMIVTLVDLPGLSGPNIAHVIENQGELVQPTYAGVPGHPVKVSRNHWHALTEALNGDEGARGYLASHPDELTVLTFEDAIPGIDLDLPPVNS